MRSYKNKSPYPEIKVKYFPNKSTEKSIIDFYIYLYYIYDI